MEYRIDATDKILGRLASRVALLLRGKDDPSYDPARLSSNRVVVYHTDRIRFSGKKLAQKFYYRHSGYLGGLKAERLRDRVARDSRVVVRDAVLGMLPKNRLRQKMIKQLILFKNETRP